DVVRAARDAVIGVPAIPGLLDLDQPWRLGVGIDVDVIVVRPPPGGVAERGLVEATVVGQDFGIGLPEPIALYLHARTLGGLVAVVEAVPVLDSAANGDVSPGG